ncbi:MAG: ATP synthase subunit I [Planctomycetota bacterium]|jgi:F1F0 ATPase subunit 2|nr:ATP synthase subunit I [Planctomycetota bacterium]
MTVVLNLVAPWLSGVGLGVFFFVGLWWTIHRGVGSRHAALWFAGSTLVRIGVALAGMYWSTGGRWEKLLACVLGFIVARVLVTRLAGPPLASVDPTAREDSHASES